MNFCLILQAQQRFKTEKVTSPTWEDTVLLNELWAYQSAFYIFVVTQQTIAAVSSSTGGKLIVCTGILSETHIHLEYVQ